MTRLLVDTQAFLWWVNGSPRVPRRVGRLFGDSGNELLLSMASCWEIAIKTSLGKLRLPQPPGAFLPLQLQANGMALLDISFSHVARVAELPFHHRDPFDRLIVAQPLVDGLPVVTADPVFTKYGVRRVWR